MNGYHTLRATFLRVIWCAECWKIVRHDKSLLPPSLPNFCKDCGNKLDKKQPIYRKDKKKFFKFVRFYHKVYGLGMSGFYSQTSRSPTWVVLIFVDSLLARTKHFYHREYALGCKREHSDENALLILNSKYDHRNYKWAEHSRDMYCPRCDGKCLLDDAAEGGKDDE